MGFSFVAHMRVAVLLPDVLGELISSFALVQPLFAASPG